MFTLLRTILGDFDYQEIEEANRILAPIYFLSYIFLVFFVLLVSKPLIYIYTCKIFVLLFPNYLYYAWLDIGQVYLNPF